MNELVVIYNGTDACRQCLGWKRIANDDEHSSWKHWPELPAPSNAAVALGIIYPIECPRRGGSGEEPATGGSEEIKSTSGVIKEVHRLRGLLALAEADAAALYDAIREAKACCTDGIHWVDCEGEAEPEPCELWIALDDMLQAFANAEHPGTALLAELTDLRATLASAHAELDRAQPIVIAAARLVETIRGDGNGRCWCAAHEADGLRSALEKARLV